MTIFKTIFALFSIFFVLLFIKCSTEPVRYNVYIKYRPDTPNELMIRYGNGVWTRIMNGSDAGVIFEETETGFILELQSNTYRIDNFYCDCYAPEDEHDEISEIVERDTYYVKVVGTKFKKREEYLIDFSQYNL